MYLIKYPRILRLTFGIAMIVFPLILILLPKTYFDHGPSLCIYTILTGTNCLGCGMTRACMRLIHLDFSDAWEYNKMSFIAFPAIIYFYSRYFVLNFRHFFNSRNTK